MEHEDNHTAEHGSYHVDCLQDLWKILENELSKLDTSDISGNMTILVGNTRSGKSTLRMLVKSSNNFANLRAVGEPPRIVDDEGNDIGDSSGFSCTTVPKIFKIAKIPDITFVDMPGGSDNRGAFQEIVGIHLLNEVVNKSKRLNFLLVIPFQAFYDDGNRRDRTAPFEFVCQIVRHVSTSSSVGLVVTKVDNHEPWSNDATVSARILSSLKALRLQINRNTNTTENQGLHPSVINSLIERESIFLVRRPQKPVGIKSIPIAQVLDSSTGKPYYQSMRQEFINFCKNLETAEKLSLFTAMPSETTKYELIGKIYPNVESQIAQKTNQILAELHGISKQQVQSLSSEKSGLVVISSRLSDAIENTAEFCRQSGRNVMASSQFIIELADILKIDHSQCKLDTLTAFEKQFGYLQSITGISFAGKSSDISSFRNNMEALYKKLMVENKATLKLHLEDWLANEIKNHVSIIQTKYMERFQMWTRYSENLHFAVKRLDQHLFKLGEILQTNDWLSSIQLLYDILGLVAGKRDRDAFHQLNVGNKNLGNVAGNANTWNGIGPVSQVKHFLQEIRNNLPSELAWNSVVNNKFDSDISVVFTSIKQCLLSEFYANFDFSKIERMASTLQQFTDNIRAYQSEINQRTQSAKLFEDIYEFCKYLKLSTSHFLQLQYGYWQDENMPEEHIPPPWHDFVSTLHNHFKKLAKFYTFMKYVTSFSNNSIEFIQKLRKLPQDNVGRKEIATLFSELGTSLEGFSPDIPPGFIKEICTSVIYLTEWNLLLQFIQNARSVPSAFCFGNSILIQNKSNLILSDIDDEKGPLKQYVSTIPELKNVIFLTDGAFFVDTDLIARNGKVKNLVIVCSQLECVGNRLIKLEGKNGQSFTLSASNGTTWEEKGKNGQKGVNGGSGGNIYLLTQKPISNPSLKFISKGGDGGKGQDGGNGYFGSDHPLITKYFCWKMEVCFIEHDELLALFCKTIGFRLPNLHDLKLKLDDINKTPNKQIFIKTKRRVQFVLVTINVLQVIAAMPKKEILNELSCLCSSFLDFTHTCDFVASPKVIFPFLCVANKLTGCLNSVGGTVCPVISYLRSTGRIRFLDVWRQREQKILGCSNKLRTYYNIVNSFEDSRTEYLLELIIKSKQLLRNVCKYVCSDQLVVGIPKAALGRITRIENKTWSSRHFSYFTLFSLQIISALVREIISVYQDGIGDQNKIKGQCGGNGGDGGLKGCPGKIRNLTSSNDHLGCAWKRSHGLSGECGTGGSGGKQGETKAVSMEIGITNLYQTFFANRGQNGYQNVNMCKGNCKKTRPISDKEIASELRNCIIKVCSTKERQAVSLLAKHDWVMKYVFTSNIFADEYLSLSLTVFDRGEGSLHKHVNLNEESEYRERLEKFRHLNTLPTGEDLATKCILSCNSYKMACLKLHQTSQPIILNLAKYLKVSLLTLDCFQQAQVTSQAADNYTGFQQSVDARILQKKEALNAAISCYLGNIDKWFQDQQQQCKEDLAGLIRVLETNEKYLLMASIFKSLGMILSFVGTNNTAIGLIGTVFAGKILTASSALEWLVPHITPAPVKIPDGITAHTSADTTRVKIASEKRVDRHIATLAAAISERPALNAILSESLESLHAVKIALASCSVTDNSIQDQILGTNNAFRNCLLNLEKIRKQLFVVLNKKRATYGDNHPLARILDTLYFDLLTNESNWEVYSRTKGSLLAAAKNRHNAVEERFVPAMDGILANVKRALGGKAPLGMSKWKLKDIILEAKTYLKTFMEGLPSMRELETGFQKIDMALEMYISLWDDIEKETDKKEMADFIAGASGIVDQFRNVEIDDDLKQNVIKIMFLTRAQLLLLEFKKIQNAFFQWAFPYAKKYMEAVGKEVQDIRAICSGKGEIDEDDIRVAAMTCKKVVEYFMETYHKSIAQTTSEDVAWCTHQFSGTPENPPFFEWSHDEHYDQIRRLLLGYPTKFLADVRKCPSGKGAIKVNKSIELRFCFSDRSQTDYQEELDILLRQLVVEMTHSGDSYYKIDSEYFCIRGQEICLLGNVETKESKTKLTENDSRAKIVDYVLSPYTEWTFSLRLAHPDPNKDQHNFFTDLADKFAHCVDLQLVGQGRFLDEVGNAWLNQKPTDVGVYYEKVERKQEMNNLDHSSPSDQNMEEIPRLNKVTADECRRTENCFQVANTPTTRNVGLPNIGNSCYINSILQCLGHTPKLADYFLSQANSNELCPQKKELTKLMRKIFIEMKTGVGMASLVDLKNCIGKRHNNFQGLDQQDAHEFLTILLSLLHTEMNCSLQNVASENENHEGLSEEMDANKAWSDYQILKNSKIVELFGGQQKSRVTCASCKQSSVTFEPFFILSLPIPNADSKINLRNCIDYFLAEEEVNGWDCPKCKIVRNATKKTDFCRLPSYLILHLKRFHFNGEWEKRLNEIDFPIDQLTLTMGTETNMPENNVYRLYAVTNHYGSMESGHYTAFCRDKDDGSWWKFNDFEVNKLQTEEVSTAAGYILFYQLQN